MYDADRCEEERARAVALVVGEEEEEERVMAVTECIRGDDSITDEAMPVVRIVVEPMRKKEYPWVVHVQAWCE